MSDQPGGTISAVSEAVERGYQSFLLRDLMAFVVPGSISLLSLAYIARWRVPLQPNKAPSLDFFSWLQERLATDLEPVQTIAFVGASYVTAWVLQGVHHGLIDWIGGLIFVILKKTPDGWQWKWYVRLIWPLSGFLFYLGALGGDRERRSGENEERTRVVSPPFEAWGSLITKGALRPDLDWKHLRGDYGSRFANKFPYFERLSILMLMTANVTIAGLLFLCAWTPRPRLWCILWVPLMLLYLEYWRIWYTRNLQNTIKVAAMEIDQRSPIFDD